MNGADSPQPYRLFRSEVVDRRRKRLAGEVIVTQPLWLGLGVVLLICIVSAAFIAAALIEWPRLVPLAQGKPNSALLGQVAGTFAFRLVDPPPVLRESSVDRRMFKLSTKGLGCGFDLPIKSLRITDEPTATPGHRVLIAYVDVSRGDMLHATGKCEGYELEASLGSISFGRMIKQSILRR